MPIQADTGGRPAPPAAAGSRVHGAAHGSADRAITDCYLFAGRWRRSRDRNTSLPVLSTAHSADCVAAPSAESLGCHSAEPSSPSLIPGCVRLRAAHRAVQIDAAGRDHRACAGQAGRSAFVERYRHPRNTVDKFLDLKFQLGRGRVPFAASRRSHRNRQSCDRLPCRVGTRDNVRERAMHTGWLDSPVSCPSRRSEYQRLQRHAPVPCCAVT